MRADAECVAEVERWLRDVFDRAVAAAGEASQLSVKPELDPEEARGVLAGLEAGLFEVDDQGYVSSKLLPPAAVDGDKQRTLPLVWTTKGGRTLYREGICQMAAATSLVLELGWPLAQVFFEPAAEQLGELAYGVDLLVRATDGRALICGDVKRSASVLNKLLNDMKACGSRTPHEKAACDMRTRANHPKVAVCRELQPRYFWAVAPGYRLAFEVVYERDTVELKRIADLPRFSPDV
jgi:hypothetical protein